MEWTTPYAVLRLDEEARPQVVNTPEDITKAKYWMQYIAEPFDVLCKTPLHPKHTKKDEKPEYWSHKDLTGKSSSTQQDWLNQWVKMGWSQSF